MADQKQNLKSEPTKKAKEEVKEVAFSSDDKKLIARLQSGKSEGKEEKEAIQVKDSKYAHYVDLKYDIHPDFGLIYKDYDLISQQRSVVFSLLKKVGSTFMQGKSISGIPLPVTLYDQFTSLQYCAELYRLLPKYAEKIGKPRGDPVERMKWMITFLIDSLHIALSQKKPWLSLPGETFQGRLGADGEYDIFAELTSYKKQTCQCIIAGKSLKAEIKRDWDVHVYPNSLKITHSLREKYFTQDGECILLKQRPVVHIDGVSIGKRTFALEDFFVLKDKKACLYGQIRFNPEKQGFFDKLFHKTDPVRSDYFKGFITKNKALLKDLSRKAFYSKDVLVFIEGNWLEQVKMDGDVMWSLDTLKIPEVKAPLPNTVVLQSDSRNRADLNELLKGNISESERLRELMTENARKDKDLRKSLSPKK